MDIREQLTLLNQTIQQPWQLDDNQLRKSFTFSDFNAALRFMVEVGQHAEALNHHPDWCNSYNTVTISLTTHSAGEVTAQDIALAERIESVVANSRS